MGRHSAAAPTATEVSFSDVHQVLIRLSHFPINQLFRFVIDGALQKKEGGYAAYEAREPGSVSAVITAMAETIRHLDKPIDIGLIKHLHRLCGEGVDMEIDDVQLGVFDNTHVVQRIMLESSSMLAFNLFLMFPPKDKRPQGAIHISEIVGGDVDIPGEEPGVRTLRNITPLLNYYTCLEPNIRRAVNQIFSDQQVDSIRRNLGFVYHPPGSFCEGGVVEFERLMQKGCDEGVGCDNPRMPNEMPDDMSTEELVVHILTVYQRAQGSQTDSLSQGDSVLYAIQELTRTHAFKDLVTRVFVGCIFFLMQIKNGDLPAMLEDPKMFPFTDIDALKERVSYGRTQTQALIDNPSAEIYGMTISTDAPVESKFRVATNKFINALAHALYEAAKSYLEPGSYHLALQCYERAYHLFLASGSSSLKNQVAYLYGIGLCHGKLQQSDILASKIAGLEALKGQPRLSSDLFDYDAYIDSYVAKLQKLMPQPSAGSVMGNHG